MLKQTCYLSLLFFFSSLNTQAYTPDAVANYIEQYSDIAIREMHRSGIPASITLAQGILESGSGMGELARFSNNHFGIKCKRDWQGPTYYIKDDDRDKRGRLIKSCFRAYDNPEASFIDHTEFLRGSERYKKLFDLAPTDYVGWAKGLRKCGYATNPKYAEALIRTVRNYQLAQYDTVPLAESPNPILDSVPEKQTTNSLYTQTPAESPTAVREEASVVPPPAMLIPEGYVRNGYKQANDPTTTQEEVIEQPQAEVPDATMMPAIEKPVKETTQEVETSRSAPALRSPNYNLGKFKRREAKTTATDYHRRDSQQRIQTPKIMKFKRRD